MFLNGLNGPNDPVASGDQLLAAIDQIAPGIAAAVTVTSPPGENVIEAIQRAMIGLTLTYEQVRLININLDRAQRGLPPLSAAQLSGQYAPGTIVLSPIHLLLLAGAIYLLVRR